MNTDTTPNTSPVRPRALSLNQLEHNPSCMDDYDPNAMSVAQAQAYIQQFLTPIQQTEIIAIMLSLGRVLAETIVSPCNVPNHNNSAMDGFAFRSYKIVGQDIS